MREGEEETQRDVEEAGGEEAGLGRDLERDPGKRSGWGLLGQERQPLTPRPRRKGISGGRDLQQ